MKFCKYIYIYILYNNNNDDDDDNNNNNNNIQTYKRLEELTHEIRTKRTGGLESQ